MIFGRNPDREKREATAERNKFILKLQSQIEKLKAHNKVLEKALVKADEDYEQMKLDYWRLLDENKRLLAEISIDEPRATVDEAWQEYCEEIMPQKTGHFYPLSGAMYKTFVTGWNAALKEKK
jgi:dsDNA-specific endonuclease/ATPase MutS2